LLRVLYVLIPLGNTMYSLRRSYIVSARKPQVSNYNTAVFEITHYFYAKRIIIITINDLRKANIIYILDDPKCTRNLLLNNT